jgi:hypothetical protein
MPYAATVTEVSSYVTAATNAVFNIEERSSIGSAGTDVLSADQTATTTGASVTSSFANSDLAANSYLWLDVASVSGTPGYLQVTIAFTYTVWAKEGKMIANDRIGITGTGFGLLTHANGEVEIIPLKNIVTTAGDLFYAQSAASQTPTVNFKAGGARLGSGSTTPTKADTSVTTFLTGTGHAIDSGYPKTADTDAANSGSGVSTITWRFSYLAGEGNAVNIIEGAIVNSITSPTTCLCHFLFSAAFTKTSSDTLTLYVNHLFYGA